MRRNKRLSLSVRTGSEEMSESTLVPSRLGIHVLSAVAYIYVFFVMQSKYTKEIVGGETTWTVDTDATIDEKVIEGKALLALDYGKSLKFDFDLDNVLPSPINVKCMLEIFYILCIKIDVCNYSME